MTEDHWTRVDELLTAALDASPEARPELLRRLCGDDDELRGRVERMLAAAEDAQWPEPGDLLTPTLDGDPPAAARTLPAGHRLGAYEIVDQLGAGGMGIVYRARDTRIGREVAIKLLPPAVLDDDSRVGRFLREAKLVSKLNHPNVLTIHEVDRCEHGLYIVSELVDGPTLRAMARHRTVSVEEAKDILRQAATGLGKAHAADVVHRDVKPDNIMVTRDGIAKVLDFGIAKALEADASMAEPLTKTGHIAGTPGYIAPEQLRGDAVDARTDVFALGVVVYELLTGKHPFPGETLVQIIDATLHRRPAPLSEVRADVPSSLSGLVERCLAKSPDRRPQDGNALVVELHELDDPGTATPGTVLAAAPSRRGLVERIADRVGGLFGSRPEPGETPVPPVTPVPTPIDELVVAVLPVTDRSGDPELELAGAGRVLSDVFLHLLTDGGQLHLVSPFLLREAAGEAGRPLEQAVEDPALARRIGAHAGANAVLTATLDKETMTGLLVLGGTVTELATGRVRRSYRAVAPGWEPLLRELAANVRAQSQTPVPDATPAPANQLVEQLPSRSLDAYAHFVRGRDFADLGQYSDALRPLEKAVELDPTLAVAWSEMGCAYHFVGDDVRSRAAHWKAEENIEHASHKERLWIAAMTVWVNTNNPELYRKKLRAFIDAYPDDRDGYQYLGYSYVLLETNPAAAIEWFERTRELTPSFFPATRMLVECWRDLGREDRAREAVETYLSQPFLTDFGRSAAEQLRKQLA